MSSFSEFISEPNKKENNIEGSFGCQTCDEHVNAGQYDYTKKILRWVCSSGHTSEIEGLSL